MAFEIEQDPVAIRCWRNWAPTFAADVHPQSFKASGTKADCQGGLERVLVRGFVRGGQPAYEMDIALPEQVGDVIDEAVARSAWDQLDQPLALKQREEG